MQRVCKVCGITTDKFSQCSNGSNVWYACIDFNNCEIRKKNNDELERKTRADKIMTEHNVDINSLVRIGCIYRNGKTYYYHEKSDKLFEATGENLLPCAIDEYKRSKIQQSLIKFVQFDKNFRMNKKKLNGNACI